MSNRGYLGAASSPDPRATLDDDLDFTDTSEMRELRTLGIAAAANVFPVLWCTLFEMRDVHRVEFTESGESDAFTVLVTSLDVAEERASANREPFLELLPSDPGQMYYDQWMSMFPLLREQNYEYIHFDAGDLEALYNLPTFELFLSRCLGSLSTMSTENVGVLLRQAGIGLDSDSRTALYPLHEGKTTIVEMNSLHQIIKVEAATVGINERSPWQGIGSRLRGHADLAGLDWSE